MNIDIEKQGLFWSVLVDMLRDLAYQMANEERPRPASARRLVARLISWGRRRALAWEAQPGRHEHPFLSSFTTGFGIRALKGADKP